MDNQAASKDTNISHSLCEKGVIVIVHPQKYRHVELNEVSRTRFPLTTAETQSHNHIYKGLSLCMICGNNVIDCANLGTVNKSHIVAHKFGGSDAPWNLVKTCSCCNHSMDTENLLEYVYENCHARFQDCAVFIIKASFLLWKLKEEKRMGELVDIQEWVDIDLLRTHFIDHMLDREKGGKVPFGGVKNYRLLHELFDLLNKEVDKMNKVLHDDFICIKKTHIENVQRFMKERQDFSILSDEFNQKTKRLNAQKICWLEVMDRYHHHPLHDIFTSSKKPTERQQPEVMMTTSFEGMESKEKLFLVKKFLDRAMLNHRWKKWSPFQRNLLEAEKVEYKWIDFIENELKRVEPNPQGACDFLKKTLKKSHHDGLSTTFPMIFSSHEKFGDVFKIIVS